MGDDRDRNDQGRYADRIDPETVLDVFDAREDHCRPLTASDIADALGIARRTAHNKLNALVERGVLETRKVGARGRVWWTPETETKNGGGAGVPVGDGPGDEGQETGATAGDEPDSEGALVTEALAGWSHGRTDAERAASRQVAERATEWLREHNEEVQRSDVPLDDLADDDPEGRTPRTLWTEVIRDAWTHAADRGYVDRPGHRSYRWIGES